MFSVMPKNYKPYCKVKCDWTDKFGYSIDCRHVKILVRQGMIIDEVFRIVRLKQKPWLETCILFITERKLDQKKIRTKTLNVDKRSLGRQWKLLGKD